MATTALKIDKKIISYALIKDASADPDQTKNDNEKTHTGPTIQEMNEAMERSECLRGVTYKIKPPILDSALYITINDMIINEGTAHEYKHPFEIFVNSKNMEHYQWIVGLTRVISAVFRKGGDVAFLVEELTSVFDPSGGYFKKGGKFMPSLVAEIGEVLRTHLEGTGKIKKEVLDENQQDLIKLKTEQAKNAGIEFTETGYPKESRVCAKCNVKAVIRLDSCDTCLSCSDSKCG